MEASSRPNKRRRSSILKVLLPADDVDRERGPKRRVSFANMFQMKNYDAEETGLYDNSLTLPVPVSEHVSPILDMERNEGAVMHRNRQNTSTNDISRIPAWNLSGTILDGEMTQMEAASFVRDVVHFESRDRHNQTMTGEVDMSMTHVENDESTHVEVDMSTYVENGDVNSPNMKNGSPNPTEVDMSITQLGDGGQPESDADNFLHFEAPSFQTTDDEDSGREHNGRFNQTVIGSPGMGAEEEEEEWCEAEDFFRELLEPINLPAIEEVSSGTENEAVANPSPVEVSTSFQSILASLTKRRLSRSYHDQTIICELDMDVSCANEDILQKSDMEIDHTLNLQAVAPITPINAASPIPNSPVTAEENEEVLQKSDMEIDQTVNLEIDQTNFEIQTVNVETATPIARLKSASSISTTLVTHSTPVFDDPAITGEMDKDRSCVNGRTKEEEYEEFLQKSDMSIDQTANGNRTCVESDDVGSPRNGSLNASVNCIHDQILESEKKLEANEQTITGEVDMDVSSEEEAENVSQKSDMEFSQETMPPIAAFHTAVEGEEELLEKSDMNISQDRLPPVAAFKSSPIPTTHFEEEELLEKSDMDVDHTVHLERGTPIAALKSESPTPTTPVTVDELQSTPTEKSRRFSGNPQMEVSFDNEGILDMSHLPKNMGLTNFTAYETMLETDALEMPEKDSPKKRLRLSAFPTEAEPQNTEVILHAAPTFAFVAEPREKSNSVRWPDLLDQTCVLPDSVRSPQVSILEGSMDASVESIYHRVLESERQLQEKAQQLEIEMREQVAQVLHSTAVEEDANQSRLLSEVSSINLHVLERTAFVPSREQSFAEPTEMKSPFMRLIHGQLLRLLHKADVNPNGIGQWFLSVLGPRSVVIIHVRIPLAISNIEEAIKGITCMAKVLSGPTNSKHVERALKAVPKTKDYIPRIVDAVLEVMRMDDAKAKPRPPLPVLPKINLNPVFTLP